MTDSSAAPDPSSPVTTASDADTPASERDCLFCRVVAGDLPATVVRESAGTVAFRDLSPQAPTHVLVVPRAHYATVGALAAADAGLLAELVGAAAAVAEAEGLDAYRLVFNTGAGAGQSVSHVHGHVLGGRAMRWPPG
jgi:histidine triad (HIT) family protein